MKKYSNRRWIGILSVAALTAMLLTGCKDERLEEELAYRKIGITSMEAGDYEGAIASFENALNQHLGKITQTEIDICYYKAAAQYALGDIEGTLQSYKDLIAFNEKDGNAYYMKGCILLQQGEYEQALSDFSNAIKYNAEDYELYISIYENLATYNLLEEGEKYLNKAFDIKGDAAENLAWRGKIYTLLGEYENAIAELSAALGKESAIANLYLAEVYDAQGDTVNAEKYYQLYVETGATDSIAMNALAEIEIGKGNYTGALDYINQGLAMETVPNRKELMQNQMIACEYTGDFATAWAVMQEYIVQYPKDVEAQREYTFLKNRQGVVEDVVEVPEAEEMTTEELSTEEEQTESATE